MSAKVTRIRKDERQIHSRKVNSIAELCYHYQSLNKKEEWLIIIMTQYIQDKTEIMFLRQQASNIIAER